MSHPGAVDADGVRRIELISATWERIQITLRFRPTDGPPIAPSTLRLRLVGAPGRGIPGVLMRLLGRSSPAGPPPESPPARATLDGDVVVARFNVMQGPGQEPLAAGRWELVESGGGVTRVLGVAAPVAAALSEADQEFVFGRMRYGVRLVAHGQHASAALEVAITPVGAADGPAVAGSDVILAAPGDAAPALSARGPVARLLRPVRWLRLGVFGLAYALFRATARHDGRRILFTSDSRSELGGNLKLVYDRMVERGLDRDYELRTLFKESITVRRGFRDRLRLPRLLARADTIVIDDYQPVISRFDDPDKRIVQLWHAWGAFKTVGYSRVGKAGGLNPYSRVHKTYTHAIVSSEAEVPFYAEAFGIPESRVYPTGIPRMDRFWDPDRAAASREAALDAYPAARGRTVYLFAPTFRGHGAKTAWYDLSLIDYPALHALCVERDAVCIIRMHPFVRSPLDIPAAYADRIIDGATSSIDINDVLFATDLLITDYSSVVFEYSTMDRPMLFFAYDLESYVAERDFYVRYEDFVPGRIVRTFDELLDAIRRGDVGSERLAAFRATHLGQFDGNATDRVIDLIVGRS
ncbi:MAG: CDP-glycerol glycerophosphotransferase family protein [Chloroflexota bacterium]